MAGFQRVGSLPAERFEDDDLWSTLTSIKNRRFRSRAVTQVMGPLLRTGSERERVQEAIWTDLGTETNRRNLAVDFDYSGAYKSFTFSKAVREFWDAIKQTNPGPVPTNAGETTTTVSGERRESENTHGRYISVSSLTPIIALQLFTSQGDHFDFDRLLSSFLGGGNSNFGDGDSWSFSMKYYYLESAPMSEVYLGQRSGDFHKAEEGLRLFRGSSTISVCLDGEGDDDDEEDDASLDAPWRVLVLSCNREEGPRKLPNFRNGVEAYFWSINRELTCVRRSMRRVSETIGSIAVPSDNFLFDPNLQDSLLFEDESYTNSRTYFWALQSLRIVNEGIASLMRAWDMYDKSELLGLMRGSDPNISRACLEATGEEEVYLQQIDRQMEQLAEMIKANNAKQEEIAVLRDGLFNASAVLEARTTVTQGQNIRILTLISMLFMPASFVTSIFGMGSVLPPSTSVHTFAILFSVICGITYSFMLFQDLRSKGIRRWKDVRPALRLWGSKKKVQSDIEKGDKKGD